MSSIIAFRVDASTVIGTGHVMRCLTLADALRARGHKCIFIARAHSGHLIDVIEQKAHALIALEAPVDQCAAADTSSYAAWLGVDWQVDAQETVRALHNYNVDWMVVDHYGLDKQWEKYLRPHCNKIMVIDDLANRSHDCDMLLDQNLGRCDQNYEGLISVSATKLIGPKYALLRPEFADWREQSMSRRMRPAFKNMLISMGGVDRDNITGQILDLLDANIFPKDGHITIIMGVHAPWLDHIRARAKNLPWKIDVLSGINNVAELMAGGDIAIGAAGGTAWERCALGLPSIIYILAENQIAGAQALERTGAAYVANDIHQVQQLLSLIAVPNEREKRLMNMSISASQICDGAGTARVVQAMQQ